MTVRDPTLVDANRGLLNALIALLEEGLVSVLILENPFLNLHEFVEINNEYLWLQFAIHAFSSLSKDSYRVTSVDFK